MKNLTYSAINPVADCLTVFLRSSQIGNPTLQTQDGFPWEIRDWETETKYGGAARQADAAAGGSGGMQVQKGSKPLGCKGCGDNM